MSSADGFFEKYVNIKECPYFLLWLMEREVEILGAELKVRRKGVPKTGPRPMVFKKQLLTLAKTIDKLKLKDFAEYYGASYGVVRLWNREPQVKEKANEFMILFAAIYVQELEKRVFSKKLDIEKYSLKTTDKAQALINDLLREVKHYHPAIQMIIVKLIEDKIKFLPDDKSFLFKVIFLNLLAVLSDRTIFNPPKDKKSKELFEENIKARGELLFHINKALFSDFKKMIKKGETKKALKICDYIEDKTLTIVKDKTDLQIKVLNKGRQKEKAQSEKTVKSVK